MVDLRGNFIMTKLHEEKFGKYLTLLFIDSYFLDATRTALEPAHRLARVGLFVATTEAGRRFAGASVDGVAATYDV